MTARAALPRDPARQAGRPAAELIAFPWPVFLPRAASAILARALAVAPRRDNCYTIYNPCAIRIFTNHGQHAGPCSRGASVRRVGYAPPRRVDSSGRLRAWWGLLWQPR